MIGIKQKKMTLFHLYLVGLHDTQHSCAGLKFLSTSPAFGMHVVSFHTDGTIHVLNCSLIGNGKYFNQLFITYSSWMVEAEQSCKINAWLKLKWNAAWNHFRFHFLTQSSNE